jgi:hypothetical protein
MICTVTSYWGRRTYTACCVLLSASTTANKRRDRRSTVLATEPPPHHDPAAPLACWYPGPLSGFEMRSTSCHPAHLCRSHAVLWRCFRKLLKKNLLFVICHQDFWSPLCVSNLNSEQTHILHTKSKNSNCPNVYIFMNFNDQQTSVLW